MRRTTWLHFEGQGGSAFGIAGEHEAHDFPDPFWLLGQMLIGSRNTMDICFTLRDGSHHIFRRRETDVEEEAAQVEQETEGAPGQALHPDGRPAGGG